MATACVPGAASGVPFFAARYIMALVCRLSAPLPHGPHELLDRDLPPLLSLRAGVVLPCVETHNPPRVAIVFDIEGEDEARAVAVLEVLETTID